MTDQIDGATPSEPIATPEAEAAPEPQVSTVEATPRDAIERAFAKLDAEDDAISEPKPEGDRKRGPDGRFVASEAADVQEADDAKEERPEQVPETKAAAEKTGFAEPPARFSAEAKAAWAAAPEPVKAEIHRAVREMEAGIEKHRAAAQEWDAIREFDDLAKRHNTSVKTALTNYVRLDTEMAKDPIKGLDLVAQQFGMTLRQVAEHVLGQPADQTQHQNEAIIMELRRELAGLKEQLGGVSTTIQEQRNASVQREVEAFAADHPRFDELSEEIARQIGAGFTLAEAYRRAELLNPVQTPAQAPAVEAAPKPDLAAQTRKGSLSLNGAPSSGSNPAHRKPPSSARDALDRAFGQLGIG